MSDLRLASMSIRQILTASHPSFLDRGRSRGIAILALVCLFAAVPGARAADEGSRESVVWRMVIERPVPPALPSPGPDPMPCLPCAPEPTGGGIVVDTSDNPRVASPPLLRGIELGVGERVYALGGSSDARMLSQYAAGSVDRLELMDPNDVLSGGEPLFLRFKVEGSSGQIYIQDTAIQ